LIFAQIFSDHCDDEGEEDYYNKEISMDELEGAVSRLKIDSAPGPDNIFSKLLINADITVLDFLLQYVICFYKSF
jgi:hypothetical protein